MSSGSDRLESRLGIITCSGLVCDHSVALRYPQGSVNKALGALNEDIVKCIMPGTIGPPLLLFGFVLEWLSV